MPGPVMTENETTATQDASAPQPEAPAEAGAAASPEEQIAKLEAEKNETRERMLRIAAEFENYKKRVRREQVEAEAKVKENLLRDFLEVVDNLERAASVDEKADVKSLQQGVSLVLRQFQSKL